MKKSNMLRRLWRVEYRLTVFYAGEGRPRNTYSRDGRLMRRKAKGLKGCECWTLYKKGPLGLPERAVDSSQWHTQKTTSK